MSGGLSQNDYLLNQVRDWAKKYDIQVQRPSDGYGPLSTRLRLRNLTTICRTHRWTAVVEGAVLCGARIAGWTDVAVPVKSSPIHIGIAGLQISRPWRQHSKDLAVSWL